MQIKKRVTWITMAFLLFASSVFAHDGKTMIGHYLSLENKPTEAQVNLLSQIIQVRFPQEVQSIGDAIIYMLRYSGYGLIDESKQSPALKNTLKKPLPVIDRNFGPMSLKDALTTLAGPAFILMQDPLNREVDFKLKPAATWRKG